VRGVAPYYLIVYLWLMKKQLLTLSAATLLSFASCERCYEFTIRTEANYYSKGSGAWQQTKRTTTTTTECGITKREAEQRRDDMAGTFEDNSGSSRVVSNVRVTYQPE